MGPASVPVINGNTDLHFIYFLLFISHLSCIMGPRVEYMPFLAVTHLGTDQTHLALPYMSSDHILLYHLTDIVKFKN